MTENITASNQSNQLGNQSKLDEFDSSKIPRSEVDDTVNNIYKIHLNEEIHDLSNEFCKYYRASKIDAEESYFALIYDISFVPPLRIIDFLHRNPFNSLINIIAWSIARISSTNAERLVLIINSYDYNNNLLSYGKNKGGISLIMVETVVQQINQLIEYLSSNGIYGYNISPSNILVKDDNNFILKEFINSYPYFYSETQYIAPELAECSKEGRRINNYKQDIYALGVSVFYSYSAQTPWGEQMKPEEYNENRFENGTYKYLVYKIKTTERLRSFFRGTMHDDALVRWKTKDINNWLDRDIEAVHDSILENKHTIGFNDRNYSTVKSLAYAIFRSWGNAGRLLKDNKLFKWASTQNVSNEILEGVKSVVEMKSQDSNSMVIIANPINANQKITKLLSVIDPNGSLRQESIAISAASIPELLQYLHVYKKKHLIESVLKIMKDEVWKHYTNHESAGYLDSKLGEKFRTLAVRTNLAMTYKSLERLVYTLNPNLPCLSPMLNGRYVTNIAQLMMALDSYAQKVSKNFNLDRNIIAFVVTKLELKEEIKPAILSAFPKLAEHFTVRTLSILNFLQQAESEVKIPNICLAMSNDLKKLFQDNLYNTEFKKAVIAKIDEVAQEGNLSSIIDALSNQHLFVNDYNGYQDACKKVKILKEHINNLDEQNVVINSAALLLGQKTTVLVSYILCFIVTVIVIM